MKQDAGFTLVEMISVLLIVGVIAVISGMAIVTGVKGYLFSRDNATIGQNAQMAMTRICRELMDLTTITSATSTEISFTTTSDTLALGLDNGVIKIAEGGAGLETGDEMVDGVDNFTLTFYKVKPGGFWLVGDGVDMLKMIKVDLVLRRPAEGTTVAFSTVVNPRHTDAPGNAYY